MRTPEPDNVPTATRARPLPWTFTALLAAALIVGVGAIYAPTVDHDFLNYDDDVYVTANPAVRDGLTPSSVSWAWTTFHAANWHPLTWMSHMLDATLHGDDPGGHHLTSVVLHAINAVLLLLLLRRMTGETARSFLVAALFAVHPLHVESVAWIAERKDVLSTSFGMWTLVAYVVYAERGGRWRYAVVVACLALGLAAKPMLVTMPVLLLLLDGWPLGRWRSGGWRPLVVEKLPLLLLSVASTVVTFSAQSAGGAVRDLVQYPLATRLANAVVAYAAYLGKAVWPARLAVPYPYHGADLGAWHVVLATTLLAAVSIVVFRLRESRPYLLAGWLWFLVSLLPVIGLVQVGDQAMADRYTYVPLIGPSIMLVWGAGDLVRAVRPASKARLASRIAVAAAVIALVAAAVRARDQVGHWRDSETLFRHTLSVTRDNYNAHLNLGMTLSDSGDLEQAVAQLGEAVRLRPDLSTARYNLGVALERLGRDDDALQQFAIALELDPSYAEAHNNVGQILVRRGRIDDGLMRFALALSIDPGLPEAHYNLGTTLAMRGDWSGAIDHLTRAVELRTDYARAHHNLGLALEQIGRAADARRELALAEQHGYVPATPDVQPR